MTLDGSGIETLTTNLNYLRAEGVEFGFGLGFDIGKFGQLAFNGTVNYYLTQEFQSDATLPITECVGVFGTACGNGPQGGPIPEIRWIQRTTWSLGDFSASLFWRHLGPVSSAIPIYADFQRISSFDYFDVYGSWNFMDKATLSLGVVNATEVEPPVVGNEAADTGSNSGNTFPGMYDVLGRYFTLGLKVAF